MQSEFDFFEEWRPVVGYEGWYEVSNLGRVRSVARVVHYPPHPTSPNGHARYYGGQLLRFTLNHRGYLLVGLKKNKHQKTCAVHVLVAAAFIGPRPPGLTIDHQNAKKQDNTIGNLEYITPEEQRRRASAFGLYKGSPPKITDIEVAEVRRLYLEGMNQRAIGKQFGISQQHVSDIVTKKYRRTR